MYLLHVGFRKSVRGETTKILTSKFFLEESRCHSPKNNFFPLVSVVRISVMPSPLDKVPVLLSSQLAFVQAKILLSIQRYL